MIVRNEPPERSPREQALLVERLGNLCPEIGREIGARSGIVPPESLCAPLFAACRLNLWTFNPENAIHQQVSRFRETVTRHFGSRMTELQRLASSS